jgi:mannose-6-phosphate isomerase-like protein (cupin superfamily)
MVHNAAMQAPRRFGPMAGATYQVGRITIAFKRTDTDSEGAYSIAESIEPPGAGASLHRHPSFAETFIVCEGCYEFQVGEELYTLGPGETIVVPLGAPHALKSLGPETGRLLDICSPAGIFEAFIKDISHAMSAEAGAAVDFRGIALRHGIEFLG